MKKILAWSLVALAVLMTGAVAQTNGALQFSSGPPAPQSWVIGVCNYLQDNPGAPLNTTTDQWQAAQNSLLKCARTRTKLISTMRFADNLNYRVFMVWRAPPMILYTTSSLVIPTGVLVDSEADIVCDGRAGSPSSTWDGTTTQALGNVERPCLLYTAKSSNANVSAEMKAGASAGTAVAGMVVGQNWVPTSAALASGGGGTGYQNGDDCYVAQPDSLPYTSAHVVIDTTSGGVVTALHLDTSNPGSYSLPSGQQTNSSYGWIGGPYTGSVAQGTTGTVFDVNNSNAYETSTANNTGASGTCHGTGLEVTLAWTADFAGSGAVYFGGSHLTGDMLLGNVNLVGVGIATDATYGPQLGVDFVAVNPDAGGNMHVGGGYHSYYWNNTGDYRGMQLNSVNAGHSCLKIINNSFNISARVRCDTANTDDLELDWAKNIDLDGSLSFNNSVGNCTGRSEPIQIGQDSNSSTSHQATGLKLNLTLDGDGASAGVAAIKGDFVPSGDFHLNITNTTAGGGTESCTVTSLLNLSGTHWAGSVTGHGDKMNSTLTSGTPASGASLYFHNDAQGWWDHGNTNREYDSGGLAVNRTSDPGVGNVDVSGCYKIAGTCNPFGFGMGLQSSRYYTTPTQTALTTLAITANTLYCVPVYLATTTTITKLSIDVTTATNTGHVEMGIYANSNGIPGSLEHDAGQTAITSGSAIQYEITGLNYSEAAGWHWLCAATDQVETLEAKPANDGISNFLLGMGSGTANGVAVTGSWTYSANSLPGSFPAVAYITTAAPLVYMRL